MIKAIKYIVIITSKVSAITVFIFISNTLTAQNIQWVDKMGGTIYDDGAAVATDASGNVFTTGTFTGTADFDPGPAVFNLTSLGLQDMYVCKTNASGNFLWAVRFGGTSTDNSSALAIDNAGAVYVTGFFQLTVDFNPGPATYNLSSLGGPDVFVLKLDAAGSFVWAKRMGAGSGDFGSGIAIDNNGLVYVTGGFSNTVDFDPGPGIFNQVSGNGDVFISTLDPNGNFIRCCKMGGTAFDTGNSIALDNSGNIYVTGYFQLSANFNPGGSFILTSSGSWDIFVVKLDNTGNFMWARRMGGTLADEASSVAADIFGNICLTGYFQGTADFDPLNGGSYLTSAGNKDIFLVKLDASGNLLWTQRKGGSGADQGVTVCTDANGRIFTSGYFNGNANFDPGSSNFSMTSFGSSDGFINCCGLNGNHLWTFQCAGPLIDQVWGSCIDNTGNFLCTGRFQNACNFDPLNGNFNYTSAGDFDAFSLKIVNPPVSLPVTLATFSVAGDIDAVTISWTTESEFNAHKFTVEKRNDASAWEVIDIIEATGFSDQTLEYNTVDWNPGKGINYYRLKQTDLDGKFNYSKILSINFTGKPYKIIAWPNPASETVTIDYPGSLNDIHSIYLKNDCGSILKSIVTPKNNQLEFNVSNYSPGIYFVELNTATGTFHCKVIIR